MFTLVLYNNIYIYDFMYQLNILKIQTMKNDSIYKYKQDK